MTDEAIAALPVKSWIAGDALVFLWTTAPMLRRSMAVADAWGIGGAYVTQLVWVKDRIGTGFWVRNRHEPVLVYRVGKFPWPGRAAFPDSVITGQQREHSRKPEALQNRIDEVWPDAVKLELFARCRRPGWQVWGNDVDRFPTAALPQSEEAA